MRRKIPTKYRISRKEFEILFFVKMVENMRDHDFKGKMKTVKSLMKRDLLDKRKNGTYKITYHGKRALQLNEHRFMAPMP